MHYYGIPLFLHPPQQLPHPALGHVHPLGSFPLRHLPVPRSFQPVQPVPLLLAHCDSFHPSALRLSIGTFYLAQLGTSHLAATPRRGKAVEINALWYNALCLLSNWAEEEDAPGQGAIYRHYAKRARESFNKQFWNPQSGYLFDVVDGASGGGKPG